MSAGRNRASTRPTIPVPRVETSPADLVEQTVRDLESAATSLERVVRRGHGNDAMRREAVSLRMCAATMRRGAAA